MIVLNGSLDEKAAYVVTGIQTAHTHLEALMMQCGCRWLIRRVPHMTRICCDAITDKTAVLLCGLLPCVSGLVTPATELSVHLDTSVRLACPFILVSLTTCYAH